MGLFISLLGAIFVTKIRLTFGEAPITCNRALSLKFNTDSDKFPVFRDANCAQKGQPKHRYSAWQAFTFSFSKAVQVEVEIFQSITQSIDMQRRPSIADVKQCTFCAHSRGR